MHVSPIARENITRDYHHVKDGSPSVLVRWRHFRRRLRCDRKRVGISGRWLAQ
jgi:hypothetical protein